MSMIPCQTAEARQRRRRSERADGSSSDNNNDYMLLLLGRKNENSRIVVRRRMSTSSSSSSSLRVCTMIWICSLVLFLSSSSSVSFAQASYFFPSPKPPSPEEKTDAINNKSTSSSSNNDETTAVPNSLSSSKTTIPIPTNGPIIVSSSASSTPSKSASISSSNKSNADTTTTFAAAAADLKKNPLVAASVESAASAVDAAIVKNCRMEDLEKANEMQLHTILEDLVQTAFFKQFVVDLNFKCPLRTWRQQKLDNDHHHGGGETSDNNNDTADKKKQAEKEKEKERELQQQQKEAEEQQQQQQEQEEDDDDIFECSGGEDELDEDAEPLCTVLPGDDQLPFGPMDSNALHSLSHDGFQSKAQQDTFAWKQHKDRVHEKSSSSSSSSTPFDAEPPFSSSLSTSSSASASTSSASEKTASKLDSSAAAAPATTSSSSDAEIDDDVPCNSDDEESKNPLLPDSFWSDMCSKIEMGPGASVVNLLLNPERNTGYNGTHIWNAIYQENCFVLDGLNNNNNAAEGMDDDDGMCLEERVLYRLLSGLHTSTTLSIAMNYYPPSKRKNRTSWEPNPTYFYQKFHRHPDHIRNLHFGFLVLLRALQKATTFLYDYDGIHTGNIVEDQTAKVLLRRLLDSSILGSCNSVFSAFDESLMFQNDTTVTTTTLKAEDEKILNVLSSSSSSSSKNRQSKNSVITLQQNFKGVFHNISSILDCVQCQQCKLHGKLAMMGYGAALKVLFMRGSGNGNGNGNTSPLLKRNEVVALINTIAKFSESIRHVRLLTNLYLEQQQAQEKEQQVVQRKETMVGVTSPSSSSSSSLLVPTTTYTATTSSTTIAAATTTTTASPVVVSPDTVDHAIGFFAAMERSNVISAQTELQLVQLALAKHTDILILAKHYSNDPNKFLQLAQLLLLLQQGGSSASGGVNLQTIETNDNEPDAIVVGSGLAGLAATLSILDRGGRVVVVEKEHLLGGNSNKASSGINACCRPEQQTNYGDSIDIFRNDTTRSAGSSARPDLIEVLVNNSAAAVDWLKTRVGVDLSLMAQLGGHSSKRTHRPSNGMAGAEIIYGMQKAVKQYEKSGKVKILLDTRVTGLLTAKDKDSDTTITTPARVTGIKYRTKDNEEAELHASHVVLATGGFAADRSPGSLLETYRPEFLKMPTTAGDFSTGDGVGLATALGAGTVDMDKVQIHPTGWVDPSDPENTSKILAAELMRGVGGILLNANGERFCNELGTRSYVTDQMLSHDPTYAKTGTWDPKAKIPTFYLVLSSSAAEDGKKHVDLYTHKGLLAKVEGVDALAKFTGQRKTSAVATLKKYQAAAKEGTDEFGKTSFRGVPQDDLDNEVFYVGRVTPVLHYCMGGITIDPEGHVVRGEDGAIIPGLYAAGEVTGGVHGVNRLGGNSLLECTVYGRRVGNFIPIRASSSSSNSPLASTSSGDSAASQKLQQRTVSLSELEKHNTEEDCWVAIHGVVYDLTDFAEEHPAGAKSIYDLGGKDGTTAFAAVHNQQLLEEFDDVRIGSLAASSSSS